MTRRKVGSIRQRKDDRLTPDDLSLVRRIRRNGKRHQDGCLDVFGRHLRDEPFDDEALFYNLAELALLP